MNKRQKLVQQQFLDNEKAVIKRLGQVYTKSLEDVTAKSQKLFDEIEALTSVYDDIEDEAEKAILKSRIQSKVYQKQYQDSLKKQVSDILDKLHKEEFQTVSEYLDICYEDGFIGTMFDLQGQGIPLCFPLDQESMVRAVQTDSKISKGLYSHLGEDVAMLKKHITAQVSRGISSGLTFSQIAQQITAKMVGQYDNPGGSLAYASRVARTEGHRIQVQAGMDACYKAKEKGADVVKQWDSTLDSRTRKEHKRADGEIRELDEEFSNGLMFPGDPNGKAKEVVNCRCALLQRARWALDKDELKTLKDRASYYGLDKADNFDEYKKKYLKAAEKLPVEIPKFTPAKTTKEAEDFIRKFVDDKQFGATGVSYSGISVETANRVNAALSDLFDTYDLEKLGGVFVAKGNTKLGKAVENAVAAYSPVRKSLILNNRAMKNVDDVVKGHAEEIRLIKMYADDPASVVFASKRAERVAKASILSGRATVPDTIEDVINHEMGHTLEKAVSKSAKFETIKGNMTKYAAKISGYATEDMSEYIAESFASYRKGEKLIDPDLKAVFQSFEKKNTKITLGNITQEVKNLDKIGKSGIMLSDKQFGKKVGKHATDFGLDPSKAEDREKTKGIIRDIIENKDDYVEGAWRGQEGTSKFFIKGEDVVVVNAQNEFVTILKGGVNSERIKNARK